MRVGHQYLYACVIDYITAENLWLLWRIVLMFHHSFLWRQISCHVFIYFNACHSRHLVFGNEVMLLSEFWWYILNISTPFRHWLYPAQKTLFIWYEHHSVLYPLNRVCSIQFVVSIYLKSAVYQFDASICTCRKSAVLVEMMIVTEYPCLILPVRTMKFSMGNPM